MIRMKDYGPPNAIERLVFLRPASNLVETCFAVQWAVPSRLQGFCPLTFVFLTVSWLRSYQ